MDVNVLRHSQLVKEVSGDVIAVSPGGSARKVLAGETIDSDNIVITINGASVIMNNAESQLSVIDENCVACVDETSTWNVAPIAGDVSVDLDKLSGAEFGEDDLAAIQDAILAGEDPTELLEATAAGGAAGSANAGFVTIDYTGAEVLASTFFETSALATEEQDDDEDELDTTALAVGGDAFSESLQEGSLSLGNYPQTITSSITIFSGDLPLDPESFVPESSSLAALLSELNTDITSSGQAVTFSYDSTENAIVGIRNADAAEVLSIDLNASQSGNDVSLTMVTTISQPIDHIVSIGGGLVSLADDQITITFDIEGADSGGNSMLAPIEAQVAVIDGADPAPTTVNIENTETDTQVLAGEFVQIGSDSLSTVAFQPSALAQFDGLFSDNQATQATLSNDAKTITLSLVESDDPVLVITIDTDGRYQFQQFKSLEHNESDELILSLPTTVTDFDLDTATNAITITIIDGQNPVINNVTAIEVDESGISGGSNEGISAVSGTGDITANAGSDAIDHFELEPSEFNTDGSLTSQGQAIQLELASSDNGVRSYQGYIVLDGTRVTVFEAQIDTPELGKYQFTLFEQLDHLGNQDSSLTINLPIYAVDTDGDRSSVTEGSLTNEAAWIQINVADDALELVDNTFSVTEPTEDGDTTFSHSLFTDTPSSEGADTATIQSFTYSGNTYNLDQSAEDNASQTFTLTEGTLTISLNGDFSFDVARDIDHSTNETINKQFVFTARDGDGDIDTATVDLAITDGQIPDIKVVPKVDLSEASLLDGTSPNSALVSSSASIVYAQGSDDVSHFRIDTDQFNSDTSLSSNGLKVELREVGDSGQYIGFTTSLTGAETQVFTLTFNNFDDADSDDKGHYTFTLLEAVDHIDAIDNDSLSFDLPVYAVDSDGDDSVMMPLSVTIEDDLQIMQGNNLTITEPSASEVSSGSNVANPSTETIELISAQGADGATITKFTFGGGDSIALDPAISGEQSFDFDEGTLYITLSGELRFEPNRDLDHSGGDITKSIVVTSSDGDKDEVTATVSLTIEDGANPEITEVPTVSLSESALADGSAPNGTPASASVVSSSAFITYTEGSDDIKHFEIAISDFNPDDTLKSNGLVVKLRENPEDSGEYLGFTVDSSNQETPVFTLTFDNYGDANSTDKGLYTFTLIEALDHQDGSDKNTVSFVLPIYAVDTDGDVSAKKSLSVTIEDDVQTMQGSSLTISEPNADELASGARPSTDTIELISSQSADGATITQFTFGDSDPISLNPTVLGEQSFNFDEGTVFITLTGELRFEPNRDLDHVNGDIKKSIVVTSSDTDKDLATATVELTIKDGQDPEITEIPAVSLSESALADGSAPNGTPVSSSTVSSSASISYAEGGDDIKHFKLATSDFNSDDTLTSSGLVVKLREEPDDSGEYLGFTEGPLGQQTPVFTLKFDNYGDADSTDKGHYTFTLIEAFDHAVVQGSNLLNFVLPVYAVDTDGGVSGQKNLSVTIKDDVQTMQGSSLTITEPSLDDLSVGAANPTTDTIELISAQSADGATITQFTFGGGDAISLNPTVSGEQSFDFDEGTLFITVSGELRFEPNRDLDHSGGDITKSIVVTSSDADKDVVTATVELTIKDGQLPEITEIPGVLLSESVLADGSEPNSALVSRTESIEYTEGSDDVSHFRIDTVQFNSDTSLSSNGLKVELREVEDSGQYIGFTTSLTGVETQVFTLTFNNYGDADSDDKGHYTFTLLEAVDHIDAIDNDSLSFDLPVYAVDSDGDDSVMMPLSVTIEDDIATIDDNTDSSEFSLNENSISNNSAQVSGGFVTTQGADGVESYQLDNLVSAAENLYSSGHKVTIEEVTGTANTTHYQGVANGKTIFTLALGDDGAYTFTLLEPLDHLNDATSLTIPFDVVAVDRDGDASEAFDLPIEIVDDTPNLSGFTGEQLVDEDDLSGIGSDQRTDPLNDTAISGQFNINEGADGVVEYRLVDASATIKDLTSGQEPLEWGTSSQSGTTFTYTAQTTSGTPIFNIVFDAADNRYQFELLGPLDHPIANSEDSIQLDFSVVAIDFDGDVSNSITLPITITDDVPTIAEVDIVRVEGDGPDDITVNMFEASNDTGADGAKLTQIEGTTSNGATIVFGNSYQSSINLRDGTQSVSVYEQKNDASGGTETRQLGVLIIDSNGEIDFSASSDLKHDGNNISFAINVTATDGDLDTSIAPVNITITDREASPVQLNVTTFEDAGRDPDIKYASGDAPEAENDQDNQQDLADMPAQVLLKVNLHDDDNDESIGSLTIKEGDHHGTFYYLKDGEYHKLDADPVTNNIVFDGSVLQQSPSLEGNNTIATINNLYFVPDKNYSTGNGGVTIGYQLEINNGGTVDHTIDSNFKIEIESVADIATWNESQSTYHYEVEEDDSNVKLQLRAESQDDSRTETITYELKVTQGEGNFELLDRNGSVISPENGVYIIASNQINRISVNPNDDFSGQIRFEATAVTKERSNSHSVDKSTAVSEPKELIIDVTPSADSGNFGVKRIQINEDNIAEPNDYESDDNYKRFTLDQVITMAPSVDADGSETLYVRISEVTQNAELVWKGNGDSQIETIEIDGVVYAEIPFDQLSNVHVVPEKHSNEDFTFKVTGVIKDSATLSDGNVHTDEEVIGSKVVNVEVKGVADTPGGATLGSHWKNFDDGDVQGVQTTINESQGGDNFAVLDFTIISGERADKPLDDSESVTVLLSNIPEGVVIEDSDGTEIDLNFVGYDSLGQPIYEANITGVHNTSGIIIRPVDSSTENIHVTANIIVTENDGHTHIFSQEVRIKVVPVIDTTNEYKTTSLGNEDSPINIHWHPEGVDYIDSDEHFTAIMIENIPVGAQVIVNNASVNMNVIDVMDSNSMVVSQTLTIDPNGLSPSEFTDIAMNSGFIQIVPPKDSSSDFELSTTVEIEERDHEYTSDGIIGEGGRVTATLTGTVNVVVRAIVEPEDDDNTLTVTNENGDIDYSPVTNGDGELEYPPISADDKGVIRFTTNSENPSLSGEYVVKYNETDQSSEEVVGDVIIQLTHTNGTALEDSVIDQLLVTGAAYEGNGRWIITNEAAFSISAPRGLDLTPNDETDANTVNQLQLKIETLVSDKGEDANERSPNEFRSTSVNLEFPETVAPGAEVAAKTTIAPDSVIDATEDIQVNLGEQLDSIITFSNKDGSQDEVTIIIDDSVTIDGVTYPISIGGAEEDFVNGQYVFQTHISESGDVGSLNGLTLTLPKDFSGDFRLPITVITKDTTSGDTNVESGNVIIHVDPIADVVGNNPKITLEVLGSLDDDMNAIDQDDNGQPDKVGYEDSYIQLDLGYQLADQVSGIEGGQEALSTVTITLPDNPSVGAFYAPDGSKIGTSLTFDPTQISNGALSNILFRANPNYPGDDDQNEVTLTISGTVTDTAVFDELEPTTSSEHSDTFTTTASFNVIPVVDDIVVTDTDGNPLVDENGEPVKEIQITTNEDQVVSLGSLLSPVAISLIDLDGSEQFVSLKLTGVPEGFFLLADSGYTVKNNGDGVWSVKIPSDAGASVDLGAISVQPPKNFSGTAEFGIAVFTQESLLGVPTLATDLPKFVLDVIPVGDDIDVDATDSVAGSEGINIDIDINASVVDKVNSISGSGIYSENGPEVLRVEVTGVPDNASIYYSDGTTLATFDSAAKVWTLDIPAPQLDKIVFNSGEHNSDDGSVLGITNPLTITIQSVDKDAENGEHLGDPVTINVALDIDPINDQPTFVAVSDLETQEDTTIAINQFSIADIDAIYDDPDASYTLTLSFDADVHDGLLEYVSYPGVDVILNDGNQLQLSGKVVDINAALAAGNVTFKPADDSNDINSGSAITMTAVVADNGNNGSVDSSGTSASLSNQTSFQISVTEVNDQPTASDIDLGSIDEEGSILIYAKDLVDATADKEGHDIRIIDLVVEGGEGHQLVKSADGTYWTFTAADEFSGDVKLKYIVEDNGTTNGNNDFLTDTASVNFVVKGVNDQPVVNGDTVTHIINEAEGQLISGISISDPDYVGGFADDLMTVTLTVSDGVLSVSLPTGSTLSVSGDNSDALTLTGTLTELNALLDNPEDPSGVHIDASLVTGNAIDLQVVAKDSGNPSGISIESDPEQYSIAVTPVADAPTLSVDPNFNYIRNITASQTASSNGIAIVGLLAALTDSTEALTLQLSGLPNGAKLTSENGEITPNAGVWTVNPEDIESLKIDSAPVGEHTLSVIAVSEESNGDTAFSDPVNVQLNVVLDATVIDTSNKTDAQQLLGEGENSALTSGSGDDRLEGGSGNDMLLGGQGDDTLEGGEGNDTLEGGLGFDVLTGGAGMDTFVWHEIDNGVTDTITDFHIEEGDKIDLRDVLPELNAENVNMETLLAHVDAAVSGDDVTLTIHPDGVGSGKQSILIEDLAPQLQLVGNDSSDILSALLDQHVIIHEL